MSTHAALVWMLHGSGGCVVGGVVVGGVGGVGRGLQRKTGCMINKIDNMCLNILRD